MRIPSTLTMLGSCGLAALLTACAGTPPPNAPTAAYHCEDGRRFTVRFDPHAAQVDMPGRARLSLTQQRAASGMWYADRGYELRGKGNDAWWTEPGAAPLTCRSV